jgi:hypothetical protein
MTVVGKTVKPGEEATISGFYECDGGCEHAFTTEKDRHIMPPMPPDCVGVAWRLVHARPDYNMDDFVGHS